MKDSFNGIQKLYLCARTVHGYPLTVEKVYWTMEALDGIQSAGVVTFLPGRHSLFTIRAWKFTQVGIRETFFLGIHKLKDVLGLSLVTQPVYMLHF